MTETLLFDPLVPLPLIYAAAALAVVFVGVALWRGLSGWWLRGEPTRRPNNRKGRA